MKLTEVAMSPTKLKKSASNIDALVGLEIEGIFKLGVKKIVKVVVNDQIESYPNVKLIDNITSYDEFMTLFSQTNEKRDHHLTGFVLTEMLPMLRDKYNVDGLYQLPPEQRDIITNQIDELLDTDQKKDIVNRRAFDAKINTYAFMIHGGFEPKYGMDVEMKYILTSPPVDDVQRRVMIGQVNPTPPHHFNDNDYEYDYHDEDDEEYDEDEYNYNNGTKQRAALYNRIQDTKFGRQIRNVVSDSSITFGNIPNLDDEYFTAEIVTQPIHYSQIGTFITEFFEYLIDDFNFQTNTSTGFHINVSVNGKTDIDFCKLMVFLGENHELLKYSRENNQYTRPQLVPGTTDTSKQKIQDVIDETNKSISSTNKYRTFNINHWNAFHYIEFRIAGGTYSTKVPLLLTSIDRYVNIMDIATDPKKHINEYHKKVSILLHRQLRQHPTQLSLKPDTLDNAKHNIEQKIGYPVNKLLSVERVLIFDKKKLISLTPIEKIWLSKMMKQYSKTE